MSEHLELVSGLLNGERMSDLCREFGISRKTGYESQRRYEAEGKRRSKNREIRWQCELDDACPGGRPPQLAVAY